MKRLIWENAIIAVLLPFVVAGLTIFGFGGWPIDVLSNVFASVFLMLLMLSNIIIIYLIISNLILAFRKWKDYKSQTLIPMGILAAGIVFSIFINGFCHWYIEYRFEKYLPQYEQVVQLIHEGSIETNEGIILPKKYSHLAYLTRAYKDSQDILTVEFWVGGAGPPPKHFLYIYRSNGSLEESPQLEVHSIKRLNEHWFIAIK
jgi:hypothetical protein